jgi:hypothetical protein
MQLRVARLCLDCEEVHDTAQCPVCASETFTYLVRWIPSDERRRRPRSDAVQPTPQASGEVETYRRLTSGEAAPATGRHLLKKGVVGLAALGVVGWLWGRKDAEPGKHPPKGRS